MFKEKCLAFSKGKEITTMLISVKDNSRTTEKIIDYRWDLYLHVNGKKIPISVRFNTTFNKHSLRKCIYYQHDLIIPTYEALRFLKEIEEYMQDYLEKEIEKQDTEKLRRVVTEGKTGKKEVNHNRYNPNYINDEKINELFSLSELEESVDDYIYNQMQIEERNKGYKNANLILYGKRGSQFAKELENRGIAKIHTFNENTTIVKPIFPYISEADELALSDYFFNQSEFREIMKKGNIQYKTANETDILRYMKKDLN